MGGMEEAVAFDRISIKITTQVNLHVLIAESILYRSTEPAPHSSNGLFYAFNVSNNCGKVSTPLYAGT